MNKQSKKNIARIVLVILAFLLVSPVVAENNGKHNVVGNTYRWDLGSQSMYVKFYADGTVTTWGNLRRGIVDEGKWGQDKDKRIIVVTVNGSDTFFKYTDASVSLTEVTYGYLFVRE